VAALKQKGDLAELKAATDLIRRGYRVAFPYGEDWDFDLILFRDAQPERVQVKHVTSDGKVLKVRCFSNSLTSGRIRAVKLYTANTVDWLAIYDPTVDQCFYIPAVELGNGKRTLHLRLAPPSYNRSADIRWARDYQALGPPVHPRPRVEPAGLEPATSRMQTECSPN
jgi:hypothetical protein